MKSLLALFAIVIVLSGCKKEEDTQHLKYRVFCKSCAIEYFDGDRVMRDTMHGLITGQDTSAAWVAGYNVVLREGSQPQISACHLSESDTSEMKITVSGDMTAERTAVEHCISY